MTGMLAPSTWVSPMKAGVPVTLRRAEGFHVGELFLHGLTFHVGAQFGDVEAEFGAISSILASVRSALFSIISGMGASTL